MAHSVAVDHPTKWPVVAVALGAGVLAAVQVGKAIVGLPAVRDELMMSLTVAGVLLSAYTYVGAALGSVAGGVVDRLGQSRVLVSALIALAGAGALGALSPGTAMLVVSRVGEGLGFMGVIVAAPALVSGAAARQHRRLAMGLWGIYMPAGQLLAMVVGPVVLPRIGWRGLWWVNAALLAAYAMVVVAVVGRAGLARPPKATPAASAPRPGLRSLAPVLPLAATFGLYSLQYLAVVGFLPTIYQANGLSQATAALLTGVVIFGNIVGNVAAGALLHRGRSPGTLMVTALTVMGVMAFAIYGGWAPFPVAFVAALVFTTFGGLLPASAFAAVPDFAPTPQSTGPANGLVVQVSNTGSILGPPLVAAVATAAGGWQLSPLVLTTAAALGLACAVTVRRRERAALIR